MLATRTTHKNTAAKGGIRARIGNGFSTWVAEGRPGDTQTSDWKLRRARAQAASTISFSSTRLMYVSRMASL
jgi:hypothetical protein